ncbi:cytochrome c oxidase accessory protein CcoG [Aureispira anguillae]|uniref:Cytochrome c oxidase accessory protein CcoG n=1 Tax=Aureispira anguillae TaxID=2864201 RepID=A0A915VML8_9BACT|nr:cytochrome c oxidase accessory protein CcoG [Aureispira anguillae]BDS09309.1 cytochrome c oxidase accessory protein CcoG [Aureispira anguillae]
MINTEESFRDSLATVDDDGNRKWVYPKKPSGKFHNYRVIVSLILLTLLFSGPFIKINGNPLLLLNVIERKFVIFGNVFYPQDFYIFMFVMAVGVIAIGIFTLVFGRLFCGWVCPQTIFMEMVFRKIEYWIEGDWNKQKALNKADMSPSKFFKKTLKHVIFFAVSFIISNTFLAYIIGIEELLEIMMAPPSEHIWGFFSILLFAFAFYIVFSRLREQICTSVCPYGRLQGVLLDQHSIVVAYDYKRGENRAKFRKNEDRAEQGKGDCVDCRQCINVCPTGIDIRNGTQLECVHCTACIDACDSIMDKLSLPGGLIRYTSEYHIKNESKLKLNKRTIGFSVLLVVLTGIILGLLLLRNKVEITVLRTPGTLSQEQPDGKISNLYNYNIVNKSNEDFSLDFKLESLTGEVQLIGDSAVTLPKGEKTAGTFFIILDKEQLKARQTPIRIGIYHQEEKVDEVNTNFLKK